MPTKPNKKRCCYCRKIFIPDHRTARQQKACREPACRKKRRAVCQQRWVKKNRYYFKGRYANTRRWLSEHPGYLEFYRQTHPEYVQKNRLKSKERRAKARQEGHVDIQDVIITQPFENINDRLKFVDVDIQDTIKGQIVVPVYVNRRLGAVDIQDKMVNRILSGYTSAIMITTSELNRFTKGLLS
jgi:hypothetical protein